LLTDNFVLGHSKIILLIGLKELFNELIKQSNLSNKYY
jgi:hypothetical protein